MKTRSFTKIFTRGIFFLMLLFAVKANAQIVNIPDPGFMANLIHYGIDTNSDGQIQVTEALAVTTLTIDYLENDYVYSLEGIEAFTNLIYLDCSGWNIGTLDVSMLTNLAALKCTANFLTNLNIAGLSNLTYLECSNNQLISINLSGLDNLQYLDCHQSGLATLNLTGLTNLDFLDCATNGLTVLDLSVCPTLTNLNCSENNLGTLDVSALNNLTTLNCSSSNISSLNLGAINSLNVLNCSINLLTSLNVTNQINLTIFACGGNQLTTLDVTTLTNLVNFEFSSNQISTINLSALSSLTDMSCGGNGLTSLDVSALLQLQSLIADNNQITSLNLSLLTNLVYLYVNNNLLTALDLSNLLNLDQVLCENNPIASIDISMVPDLERLDVNGSTSVIVNNPVNLQTLSLNTNVPNDLDFNNLSQLTTLSYASPITALDISACTLLQSATISGCPNLAYLNAKNGYLYVINANYNISACPNLQYVCADEPNIPQFENLLTTGAGNSASFHVNSYCSFSPGGDYNTISGTVRYDESGNGCDEAAQTNTFIKVKIDDGITDGASFTDAGGNYGFFTQAGDFTVTPDIENPAYFSVSPESQAVNFASVDNLSQTVDFCISANGIHPEAQIIIMQYQNARPGFDADYQIVYTNTGNQTVSGTIQVVFNDLLTDFVFANPIIGSQDVNILTWTYANLRPFETRTIDFTLNINSPIDVPAVNDGDLLNFETTIFYDGGALSDSFSWIQTVVNSLDPNDKICVEGTSVSPDVIGEYLHYNISFENIGTASAINVVVKDIINSSQFDVSSLRVLSSSHPVEVKVLGDIIEFIFEDINLPSVISDPIGGHGNVLFKIKTLPTLQIGDLVENQANIYFDYNAPIDTNVARTTFETLGKTDFIKDESISVYPNPANDFVKIKAKGNIKSIQLFDIQERILQTSIENKDAVTIDIANKQNGIYFIKVTTDKGSTVKKIIKE